MFLTPFRAAARLASPWRGYEAHRPPKPDPMPWRTLLHRRGRKELLATIRRGDPALKADWERRCRLAWPGKRRWEVLTWVIFAVCLASGVAAGVMMQFQEPEDTLAPIFLVAGAVVPATAWTWLITRKEAKTWGAHLDTERLPDHAPNRPS